MTIQISPKRTANIGATDSAPAAGPTGALATGHPSGPSFEHDLASVVSGGRQPISRARVRSHLEELIAARGHELSAQLPPAYRASLDKAIETFGPALSGQEINGLRFAVAQALVKHLSNGG